MKSTALLPTRIIRAATCCALALAAFVGTAWTLFSGLPPREIETVSSKLRRLKADRERFTTLFLGSSRIYAHVSPKLFDEILATNGIASSSFNMGVNGMSAPEIFYYLRRILEIEPPRLRYVFIEASGLALRAREKKEETVRNLYWRDCYHTRLLLQHLAEVEKMSMAEKWDTALYILKYASRNLLNIGRGVELAGRYCAVLPVRRKESRDQIEDELGFAPTDRGLAGPDQTAAFLRAVRATTPQKSPERKKGGVLAAEVARFEAALQARGVTVVWVVTPVAGVPSYSRLADTFPGRVVWSFCNPEAFPALYQPENRLDAHHLNRRGAIEFTRLLAGQFVRNVATLR